MFNLSLNNLNNEQIKILEMNGWTLSFENKNLIRAINNDGSLIEGSQTKGFLLCKIIEILEEDIYHTNNFNIEDIISNFKLEFSNDNYLSCFVNSFPFFTCELNYLSKIKKIIPNVAYDFSPEKYLSFKKNQIKKFENSVYKSEFKYYEKENILAVKDFEDPFSVESKKETSKYLEEVFCLLEENFPDEEIYSQEDILSYFKIDCYCESPLELKDSYSNDYTGNCALWLVSELKSIYEKDVFHKTKPTTCFYLI